MTFFYGRNQKLYKNKIIKNYTGFSGNVGFAGVGIIGGHLVWHREAFYVDDFNYSRGLDLGIGVQQSFDSNVDLANDGFVLSL